MKAKLVLAAAVLAAGLGTAAILAHTANAWAPDNLPPNCAETAHTETVNSDGSRTYGFSFRCDGDTVNLVYGTSDYPVAPTNPDFQAQLDAFVNAHYTAPTTTATETTTAETTTEQTTTAPTTTAAAPPSTTTVDNTTTVAAPASIPPTASFTTTPTGLVVDFTDTSTAGSAPISKVTWLFGDGANDTGGEVGHTYTDAGNFNVVELVTDANGLSDRSTQTVDVSPFGGQAPFAETKNAALATAATASFGQPLAVFCVRSWGKTKAEHGYGLSIVGSHQANIWNGGCKALRSKRGPVALSLLVLGHEVAHALGIKSERTADCYSLKRLPKLERALRIADHGYRAKEAKIVRKKWGRC